jgi:hypothetical protein
MSKIALVERLTIGSRCGSASFFTRVRIGSGDSATVYDSLFCPPNFSLSFLRQSHRQQIDKLKFVGHLRQTLNHGVTQTYLIVNTKRRNSLTGIASKTLTAKN